MMFHVGQKVICIDDDWTPTPTSYRGQFPLPVKGSVYVIVGINPYPPGEDYLELAEIGSVGDFVVTHFRPVKDTDISIFTSMLNNVPLHERETVGDRS